MYSTNQEQNKVNYVEIIESIKKKDQSGLENLYNSYGGKLYGYAINNWKLTEDESWELVYKTLLKILEVIKKYEFQSEKHFKNWIYKIFKNELRQYLRESAHRTSEKVFLNIDSIRTDLSIHDPEWETIADGIRMMDDHVIDELLLKEDSINPSIIALEEALEKMYESDRLLLLLRAQGYNYDEIAAFLGINKKNLKVKHLRAKRKLLKLFGSLIKE